MGFLRKMGEQYPWSPQYLSLYDKELNGNYVQLSTIQTQSSNASFLEKTAEKDATQMIYFDFGGQQLEKTLKKNHYLLFNNNAYNIKYVGGTKYSGQNAKI